MALWLTLLLGVALPIAAMVAAALYVYRRRRQPRNAPPELPIGGAAGAGAAAASPGLEKLTSKYTYSSGRVGIRFQQLHHHHHTKHRAGAQQQEQGPFQWGDHPRLVTEAAEHGWAQFVFAVAPPPPPPRTRSSAASSPLWGLCPVCDAGTSGELTTEAAAWDEPVGSSERMQAVRLNPATTATGKKWSVTSPLRSSDHQDPTVKGSNSALCVARMGVPLPGPPMAGTPFPQDAYFEITIIYLNTRRPEWSTSSSRTSRRGKDGGSAGETDRVKLIDDFAPDTNTIQLETTTAARQDGQQRDNKQRHLVMSLGLAAGSASSSLAGTYASSIGFHSNGAVYLDGMKLAYESDKSSWAGVDKVVGCGFDPAKRKVYFTVDGQLAHKVSCGADAFASPLYPCLASSFDVMALVNLGQNRFRYAPANARRTANPCFVRSASLGRGRRSGSAVGLDLDDDDSGELFSMGRVDSGWTDTTSRASKSRKDNGAGDLDPESDLFEISL